MRLVHLADLHLSYRQFQRLNAQGINQREADVGLTFQRAVDRIIELAPDVVLVAGDVFHSARPSNLALIHAFRQFQRLRTAHPDAIIVIAAGNHDLPRTSDVGCPLGLFAEIGIHVATSTQRLAFGELEIVAVPDVPGTRPLPEPSPGFRYNVMVIHGEAAGVMAHRGSADRRASEIPLPELHADAWHYVALGHYHVYSHVAGNAYYSGSIDYTSTNPWSEIGPPGKGFIEHDLATGAHTFNPVAPAREFMDLPVVEGGGLAAADIDAAIRGTVEECRDGIDGKVVRLVVRGVSREVKRAIDPRQLREYRRRALHFQLDICVAAELRTRIAAIRERRKPIEQLVRERLGNLDIGPDVDRERLVALGDSYLRQADEQERESLATGEAAA